MRHRILFLAAALGACGQNQSVVGSAADASTDTAADRTVALDAPDVASAPDVVDAPTTDRPDVALSDVALSDVVDATSPDRPDIALTDIVDVAPLDRPDVIDAPTADTPDVALPDVVAAPDVALPDVVDAGMCNPSLGAQPVRPLSGARVTGRDIPFRWTLPPGATGARLEFCENRACSPVSRAETVNGSALRTGVAGRRWWRVQALQNGAPCGPVSPTWWVMPDARTGEGQPYRVLTDLNGDSVTDAFLAGQNAFSGAGRVYVYVGNSTMGLPPTPSQTLSAPVGGAGQYGAPAAGDFNGDGFTDLAVWQTNASNQYQGQVWSYLSNGTQIVTAPTALTPPTPAYSHFGTFMFPGDFNGDGYTDLAVASGMLEVSGALDDPQGGRVTVYPGSAAGLSGLSAQTIPSPGGAGSQFGNSGAVVDLNNDGYDDLLVNLFVGSSRVWVHLRGGPAGLQRVTPDLSAIANSPISGGGPSNLGDVTGDGRVDVGTVAFVSGAWRALVGSGADGANSLPTTGFTVTLADSPTNGNRLVSADLTNDGVSDLVLTQVVGGESRIYLYESSRTAATYLTHVAPFAGQPGYDGPITIGDYNGDAVFDVLAGHPSFSSNRGAFSVVLGAARGFIQSMNGRGVTSVDASANLGNRIATLTLPRTPRRL